MKLKSSNMATVTPEETVEEILDDLEMLDMEMDEKEFEARRLVGRVMKLTHELDFLSNPRKQEVKKQYNVIRRLQTLRRQPRFGTWFENISKQSN